MHIRPVVFAAALFSLAAQAATILPPTSLGGLNVGDTYAFVFVTSTTTAATSTSLSTYNTFVQNLANAAGIGNTIGLTWHAMVSTGVSPNRAMDNAPISATTKVYLLDGTMVANGGTNPFYSLTTDHLAPINLSEAMTTINARVWTGGNANGSESGSGLLGLSTPVYGQSAGTYSPNGYANSWARNQNASNTNSYSLYAVSAVQTYTTAAVPEPGTLGMGLSGAVALLLWARRRNRRA